MSNWSQAFQLRNRFHAAVYLFSNRSQNMSQCGNSGTRDTTKCVTDFLTTFRYLLHMFTVTLKTHSNMESTCLYIYLLCDVLLSNLEPFTIDLKTKQGKLTEHVSNRRKFRHKIDIVYLAYMEARLFLLSR